MQQTSHRGRRRRVAWVPLWLIGTMALCHAATVVAGEDLPKVPPDVRIQLVAADPLVRNPSALAFDPRGRLTVGHGPQYRGPTPDTEGDRVDFLFDDDGDGVADRAHTFARGFNSIQGLAWRGGDLYIANAPDLTIVRDLDGDDVADEYVRLFTGLGSLEHGLHGLHFAPDGRLSMSKGNTKGRNTLDQLAPKAFRDLWGLPSPEAAADFPEPVVFTAETYQKNYKEPHDDWGQQGGVLRCQPDGTQLEIVARGMRNPWDIAYDDRFTWLGTDNDQTQGDKFIAPFYGSHYGWGHAWSFDWEGRDHLPTVPANGPLFEGSGAGIVWFDEPGLPERFRGCFLVADWMRRVLSVYRPEWRGTQRMPAGVESLDDFELLADAGGGRAMSMSSGVLFDPTDLEVGPDGCVYVASWGREYALAENAQGEQTNAGRIFRLSGADVSSLPLQQLPPSDTALSARSIDSLLSDLNSPLEARRVVAQNELVRRGDAASLLARLTSDGLTTRQQTWLAWAAARCAANATDDEDPVTAFFLARLGDDHPLETRLEAVRILAFRQVAAERLAHLFMDPLPRLRFEAAVAAREIAESAAAQGRNDGTRDDHTVAELLTAIDNETDRLAFYAQWQAVRAVASGTQRRALLADTRGPVRLAALLGLLEDNALSETDVRPLAADAAPQVAAIAARWLETSGSHTTPLLAMSPPPGTPFDGDSLAVTLATSVDGGTIHYTLDGTPPVETSPVSKGTVDVRDGQTLRAVVLRKRLVVGRPLEGRWPRNPHGTYVPQRFHEAIAAGEPLMQPAENPVTLDAVLAALPDADPLEGRDLFFHARGAGCSLCHRLEGRGNVFAPNLSDIGSRGSATAIIESILEPSKVITEGFAGQVFTMDDGTAVSGIVLAESARQIRLAMTDGVEKTLEVARIDDRSSLQISAMPSGFETAMNAAQVAALTAFLKLQTRGFAFDESDDQLSLRLDGQRIATYLLRDEALTRRAFVNVHTPSGIPVTRRFPSQTPDNNDHPEMHPGIWMSFGWIDGNDYWRLTSPVVFDRFLQPPTANGNEATFATRDRYMDPAGEKTICMQDTSYRWQRVDQGLRLDWDATFFSDEHDVVFGDQEESGLAIRIASPLRVDGGSGEIQNDQGQRNGKGTWGQEFTWIDYSGTVGDVRAGILIVPHPDNPRASWAHSRDYGALVANPFPRQPKERREPYVTTTIPKGKPFRLRYSLLIHEGPAETFDAEALARTLRE